MIFDSCSFVCLQRIFSSHSMTTMIHASLCAWISWSVSYAYNLNFWITTFFVQRRPCAKLATAILTLTWSQHQPVSSATSKPAGFLFYCISLLTFDLNFTPEWSAETIKCASSAFQFSCQLKPQYHFYCCGGGWQKCQLSWRRAGGRRGSGVLSSFRAFARQLISFSSGFSFSTKKGFFNTQTGFSVSGIVRLIVGQNAKKISPETLMAFNKRSSCFELTTIHCGSTWSTTKKNEEHWASLRRKRKGRDHVLPRQVGRALT